MVLIYSDKVLRVVILWRVRFSTMAGVGGNVLITASPMLLTNEQI